MSRRDLDQIDLHEQQTLVRLSREITNTTSLPDTLKIVLETLREFMTFKGGSISLIDPHQQLYMAASVPPVDDAVRALRLPIGQGISGWIAKRQQPFYSPDLDAETRVHPSFRNTGSNAAIRSFLGVPLVTRGQCIGVLEVDSSEPDAFTPEHQRLLQTVAAQVSGAIENARLLEERRDFSRRLQLIYSAANELTSHFDLDLLLEEFVRRAAELLQARYAAVAIFGEQRRIEKFVDIGLTEEQRELLGETPRGHGLLAHIFERQAPLRLDDLTRHPAAVGFPPNHPIMHSLLAAPLIARGDVQGAIYLTEKLDGQPFTAEDEELLMLLASGASAAISNARLYVQLRRNIEQLYALHQIGQAIGSSLSQDELIRVFALDVQRLCGAEASVISEWNPARRELNLLNREGLPELLQARDRPRIQDQIAEAARSGQALSLSLHAGENHGASIYGYLAPLTARGKPIGLAEIYAHNSNVISPESSSLFLTLTAQLAVSMENARLYTQLQKREQQLRNFVGRLFQAEDGERRRMAYEIHDGLAQLIVAADIHMNNFASVRREDADQAERELQKGLQRLKASLTEVRRVVSELRPSTLDDFGLINTLRRHVEQLAAEQGWEYSFDENLGEVRLDPTRETGAVRIVQESLNNIRKYSDTTRVAVELKQEEDLLKIRVQDWGKGFDLEEARQREGHFGLSSMEERARLLGGWFEVDSHPGQGTTIRVELPCYLAVPTIHP